MDKTIFDVQPAQYRLPVRATRQNFPNDITFRVASFNPGPIYLAAGLKLKPFRRTQGGLMVADLFPTSPGLCACGCGEKLSGRRTRWAADACGKFANAVFEIIYGHTGPISFYLGRLYGQVCAHCGNDREQLPPERWLHPRNGGEPIKTMPLELAVDHIHPVKLGGGGMWLSGYQLLCKTCHHDKTCRDFGWKNKKDTKTLPLPL